LHIDEKKEKNEHISLSQTLEDTKENKVETKNKLTHKANQNCVWPSFEEEEQKRSLVEGRWVERNVLGQAHEWGGRWT
jgi:hypothetical protein